MMNFKWKLGESFRNDWTWDEIQNCNPKATSWNWKRIREGKLYPLPAQCIKVLVLGAPQVGKSTLLWSYFDECDGPTVPVTACYNKCELHMHNMEDNGVDVQAYYCDVSQALSFLQLDEAVYRDTNVVIYNYAIDNVQSLSDLMCSWVPHSRLVLGNLPSILVGNMIDLRDNNGVNNMLVTREMGEYARDVCGINRFFECSIEDGNTPQEIFQTALRLALHNEN